MPPISLRGDKCRRPTCTRLRLLNSATPSFCAAPPLTSREEERCSALASWCEQAALSAAMPLGELFLGLLLPDSQLATSRRCLE